MKKVKKKDYGESYRIKKKTIDLIDEINPDEIPFNTKLYKIVHDYAKRIGMNV